MSGPENATPSSTAAVGGDLRLLDDLAASAAPEGPLREAFASLLHGAAGNPVVLVRVRQDPLLAPVAEPFEELMASLTEQAKEGWSLTRDAARDALERCEPWTLMEDQPIGEDFRGLQERQAEAEQMASRGDPFAEIRATEAIEDVVGAADELSARAREAVTAARLKAVERLEALVQRAPADLRGTEEWVEAATGVQDARAAFEGIDELDEGAVRDALEHVRHQVAVHEEMLDVTHEEMQRRVRARTEERQYRQAEDRAVLFMWQEKQKVMHLQFGGSVLLAFALFWLGPAVVVAVAPTVFALWRAQEGRAIFRGRVWSLPRSEVDPDAEGLSTRLIVGILLVVAIGIEAVILWMIDQLPG